MEKKVAEGGRAGYGPDPEAKYSVPSKEHSYPCRTDKNIS